MPLGTEVDLSPGHIVLEGDPAPPRKGYSSPPSFRPMSIVATVAHLRYCLAVNSASYNGCCARYTGRGTRIAVEFS